MLSLKCLQHSKSSWYAGAKTYTDFIIKCSLSIDSFICIPTNIL